MASASVVYDVTGTQSWRQGQHHGVTAGADVTERFVDSGHAVAHLQQLPVIGALPE